MNTIIHILIHLFLLLLMPPLLLGIINKTKALFAGRVGPSIFQTYFDILKLLRKGMVISRATTWVFIAGPVVTLAAVLIAGLLIPLSGFNAPVSFAGDLILFAYLFGLARFFTTAAALDTGSAFEGMGAAREVTFACLSEPALFLALLVLVKASGALSLSAILHNPAGGLALAGTAPLVCIGIGLFIVLLAETCRIPVDDPNTHLELTMIHEVMVLDHSGPLFGMILYSASLKLFVLGALLLRVVAPFHAQLDWMNWPLFVIELSGLAIAIGAVESLMARLQMRHVPYLLVAASLFCGFGFILALR